MSQVPYAICAPGSSAGRLTGRRASPSISWAIRKPTHQCQAQSRESPRLAQKHAAREERATSGVGRQAARRRVEDDLDDE